MKNIGKTLSNLYMDSCHSNTKKITQILLNKGNELTKAKIDRENVCGAKKIKDEVNYLLDQQKQPNLTKEQKNVIEQELSATRKAFVKTVNPNPIQGANIGMEVNKDSSVIRELKNNGVTDTNMISNSDKTFEATKIMGNKLSEEQQLKAGKLVISSLIRTDHFLPINDGNRGAAIANITTLLLASNDFKNKQVEYRNHIVPGNDRDNTNVNQVMNKIGRLFNQVVANNHNNDAVAAHFCNDGPAALDWENHIKLLSNDVRNANLAADNAGNEANQARDTLKNLVSEISAVFKVNLTAQLNALDVAARDARNAAANDVDNNGVDANDPADDDIKQTFVIDSLLAVISAMNAAGIKGLGAGGAAVELNAINDGNIHTMAAGFTHNYAVVNNNNATVLKNRAFAPALKKTFNLEAGGLRELKENINDKIEKTIHNFMINTQELDAVAHKLAENNPILLRDILREAINSSNCFKNEIVDEGARDVIINAMLSNANNAHQLIINTNDLIAVITNLSTAIKGKDFVEGFLNFNDANGINAHIAARLAARMGGANPFDNNATTTIKYLFTRDEVEAERKIFAEEVLKAKWGQFEEGYVDPYYLLNGKADALLNAEISVDQVIEAYSTSIACEKEHVKILNESIKEIEQSNQQQEMNNIEKKIIEQMGRDIIEQQHKLEQGQKLKDLDKQSIALERKIEKLNR